MDKDPVLEARLRALEGHLEAWAKEPRAWQGQWNLTGLSHIPKTLAPTLQRVVAKEAERLLGELRRVRESLQTDAAWQTAWADYAQLYRESQSLFARCLLFLRGLAFRHSLATLPDQLMRDRNTVFAVADWLVSAPVSDKLGEDWKGLVALPGANDPLVDAGWAVAFVRFPAWEIWAVPLVAHDYAQLMIQSLPYLQDIAARWQEAELRRLPPPPLDRHLPLLLADALATFLLGPTYACALVMLSLNAAGAYAPEPERPAAALRCHVILTMLECMSQKEQVHGEPPPYKEITDRLRQNWTKMLTMAGEAAALSPDDETQLNDLLLACWKTLTEPTVPDSGTPPVTPPDIGYHAWKSTEAKDGWDHAKRWSAQWLRDKNDPARNSLQVPIRTKGKVTMPGNVPELYVPTLRDALNAAWHLRLTQDNIEIKLIASAVLSLCEQSIIECEQPPSASSGGSAASGSARHPGKAVGLSTGSSALSRTSGPTMPPPPPPPRQPIPLPGSALGATVTTATDPSQGSGPGDLSNFTGDAADQSTTRPTNLQWSWHKLD